MEIPEDIERAAREVIRKVEAMPSAGNAFIVADEIWRRVLAERERCANVVEGIGDVGRDWALTSFMGSLRRDIAAAIRRPALSTSESTKK